MGGDFLKISVFGKFKGFFLEKNGFFAKERLKAKHKNYLVWITKESKTFCRKCSFAWLFDHIFFEDIWREVGGSFIKHHGL